MCKGQFPLGDEDMFPSLLLQCNTTFFDAAANNPNLGLLSTALTSLAPVTVWQMCDCCYKAADATENAIVQQVPGRNKAIGRLADGSRQRGAVARCKHHCVCAN
jgi:hypothetical protein